MAIPEIGSPCITIGGKVYNVKSWTIKRDPWCLLNRLRRKTTYETVTFNIEYKEGE